MKNDQVKIVYRQVDDLKEYENNPRHNDGAVEAVANSIEAFGFKVPIVVDANDVIVAGHTRLKAARRLGLEQVPCIVADDLTEEQVRAFRLADNKTAELSEWDYEELNKQIDVLRKVIDMTAFGFYDEPEAPAAKTDDADEHPGEIKCPRCGRWQRA